MTSKTSRVVRSARCPSAPVAEAIEPRLLFAAGDLDLSFGTNGFTTLRGHADDRIVDVQSVNGKTYIGVDHHSIIDDQYFQDDFYILRVGKTGLVERTIRPADVQFGEVIGFTVQNDGKLLLTGRRESFGYGIARLTANGAADPTFSQSDAFSLALNVTSAPLVLPDGHILIGGTFDVGGYYDPQRFGIVKLDAAGHYDRSFGSSGVAILPDVSGYITKLVRQPDGKIIAGGQWSDYDTDTGAVIVRLNANGTRDTSWAGANSGAMGDFDRLLGLNLAPNGDIVYVWTISSGGDGYLEPYRVSSDGTKTTAYERFVMPSRDWDYNNVGAALGSDGKLIVSGGFGTNPIDGFPGGSWTSFDSSKIARWDADGSFDPSMGGNGLRDVSHAGAGQLQSGDNKLVMASMDRTGKLWISRRRTDAPAAADGVRLLNGSLSVTGTSGNDTIRVRVDGSQLVIVSRGVEHRFAKTAAKAVYIDGSYGDDTITIAASGVHVRVNAGQGNDFVDGGTWVDGNTGDDRIILRGNGYAQGGWGSDTIDASYSTASVISAASGRPEFNGYFSDSPGAKNTLTFANRSRAVTLSQADLSFDLGFNFQTLVLTRFADKLVFSRSDPLTVFAGAGNDTITSKGTALRGAILYGEAGNDRFFTVNATADLLFGGAGNDLAVIDRGIDTAKEIEAMQRVLA